MKPSRTYITQNAMIIIEGSMSAGKVSFKNSIINE
jgi:hypothetical protein